MVTLDLRTLYLRDLKLIGETCWDEPVFHNVVKCIDQGSIKPMVSAQATLVLLP